MSKIEDFNHKVLGLTGQEVPVEVKFKTFCQLCDRSILPGDSALLLRGENKWEFYIHVDCAVAQMTRTHNHFFRNHVKQKNNRKRTNKRKEAHQGDGSAYCSFCKKVITSEQKYVKDGKKSYHYFMKNSCWTRYSRVMRNRRETV